MTNFFQWLITSSVDPKKTSVTVQGFLWGILPLIMWVTGATEAEIQPFIDGLVDLTFYASSAVPVLVMFYGLIRKNRAGRWSAYRG